MFSESGDDAYERGIRDGYELALKALIAARDEITEPGNAPFIAGATVPRGMTRMIVLEILQKEFPRALSPAAIIKLARSPLKGTSVQRDLGKLVEAGKVEKVDGAIAYRFVQPK